MWVKELEQREWMNSVALDFDNVLALLKCLLKTPIQFQTLNFILVESKLKLIF
jgi:hypothetical protein